MWTSQQFRRSSRVRWFTRTIYCVLNITWGLSECLPSCLTYQICSYKAAWWKWTPNTVHGSEISRTWTTQNPLQTLWATFHHMQHLHLWSISSQQKVSYISIWWLIACQVCMVPDIQGIKVGAPDIGLLREDVYPPGHFWSMRGWWWFHLKEWRFFLVAKLDRYMRSCQNKWRNRVVRSCLELRSGSGHWYMRPPQNRYPTIHIQNLQNRFGDGIFPKQAILPVLVARIIECTCFWMSLWTFCPDLLVGHCRILLIQLPSAGKALATQSASSEHGGKGRIFALEPAFQPTWLKRSYAILLVLVTDLSTG